MNSAKENRGKSGVTGPSSVLVNQLHERNVIQYFIFSFDIERDLSSANRSETLSLRKRSAEFNFDFKTLFNLWGWL